MKLQMNNIGAIKKGLVLTKNLLIKQSPIILTVAAVGGVITTVVMAVRATTKAQELIDEKKEELEKEPEEKLTVEETVKTCWRPFVPVAVSAGLTIAAIVGSSAINEKRKAALAGLYALSETALKEYQEKTGELLGPKTEQKIRDAVNTDKAAETDIQMAKPGVTFSPGDVWTKDPLTGAMFPSSFHKIKAAAVEINECIQGGDCMASLNDFYDILDVDQCNLGREVGWNLGHLCKPYVVSGLASDGTPILVLDWERHGEPFFGYRDI